MQKSWRHGSDESRAGLCRCNVAEGSGSHRTIFFPTDPRSKPLTARPAQMLSNIEMQRQKGANYFFHQDAGGVTFPEAHSAWAARKGPKPYSNVPPFGNAA